MTTASTWAIIATIAVGGFLFRAAFLLFPLRGDVPPRVQFILGLVPPAALAALVVPAVLMPEGTLQIVGPGPIAGVVALVVSWRTGNLALTMLVGLASYGLLDLVL